MQTIAGLRNGVLYTIQEPPYEPRWSKSHIQKFLGICATGMSHGDDFDPTKVQKRNAGPQVWVKKGQ